MTIFWHPTKIDVISFEKGSDKEEYLFIPASERMFHRLKEYLAVDTGKVALEPENRRAWQQQPVSSHG